MTGLGVRHVLFTGALVVSAIGSLSAQSVVAANESSKIDRRMAETLFSRPVTVSLDQASVQQAIDALVASAGVHAAYQRHVLASVRKSVTLRAKNMPLGTALDRVLAGTALQAEAIAADVVKIEPVGESSTTGIITGKVIDADTKRPVSAAAISMDGSSATIQTQEDGSFRVVGLAPGSHRLKVRRIGYQVVSQMVDVTEGATVTVTIALSSAPTRLNEVVTTAVGVQRRLEVGNVIAHLDVDSIVKTAPVTSLTDLLSGRAPGVQVIEANGLVGSGQAIRIRGQSSVLLSSDPIVIVDGVRQDNTPGGRSGIFGSFGTLSTPSRLNDLDVNQIETIDILKGPAASTEYGTDAANGVIVITTKRGTAGPPQWRLSGNRGWSDVPVGFAESYFAWGHTTDVARTPVQCTLVPYNGGPSLVDSTCVVDSVTHYNPLNHRATSMYGTGLNENAELSVSGGTNSIRYFVAGGTSHDVGTTKLPDVFRSQALALGFPEGILDPNSQNQQSIRANLAAPIGRQMELNLNSAYFTTRMQAPGAAQLMSGPMFGPSIPDSAHNYGYGYIAGYGTYNSASPLVTLGQMSSEATTRSTVGGTVDWRPRSWFSGHATVGIDHGSQRSQTLFLPQAWQVNYGQQDNGQLSVDNSTTDNNSADARGALSVPLTPVIRSVTSVGLQIASTHTQGVTAAVSGGLTAANSTLNGVPSPSVFQAGNASATVGGYFEELISAADRLFLTGALRLDGASGFGGDYRTTAYPKVSASWLALNTGSATVRLRAAYGAAGQQPSNGAALQLYSSTVTYINGGQVGGSYLSSPGNPNLRPERTQEFEEGFDVGLWGDRISLEFTHYHKRTKDALVSTPLGWDFGNASIQQNLGDVENSGLEGTLQTTILRTTAAIWSVTLNASSNANKLIRLAPGISAPYVGIAQRQMPGYPLYGFWGRVVTYQDTDHNGIITTDEVTIADTATYLGSSLPKVETSLSTQLSLLNGSISIGALIDARDGGKVYNRNPFIAALFGTTRAQNDPTASLKEQAIAVSTNQTYDDHMSLTVEDGSFIRFRELSLTYAVPARWTRSVRLQSLSLTAKVRNIGLWSHYSGSDPEASDALGASNTVDARADAGSAVPLPRTWFLSFNLGL